MKRAKYLIITLAFSVFSITASSQMLAPEDPGGEPVGEEPLGGGAPVGSGMIVLLSLGALYGGRLTYLLVKETED